MQNWSKDGQYVYFLIWGERKGVLRVGISNRKVEQAASLEKVGPTGNVAIWVGLASDDSLLALRDTSIQEIYALELEAP
jgi:hypothetical protein